ncbi:reverse partial [Lasallia pustulata]|uniref:Reverse partial n=1 Tax=Lasallia pustulata TaxID=136370 RepID=A0A1W5CW05_9LECA|nr:reverse partial [Lasallia pustulata]
MDPKLNILDGFTEVDRMLVEAIKVLFMLERYNDQGAFNVILVEIGDELKDRLKQAYMTDKRWSKIGEGIKGKDSAPTAAFPDFCMHNDLIYLIDHDKRERLVMPKTLEKEVFELSHNSSNHQGFHCTFDRLMTSLYFDQNAAKRFREYIEHCPACQLNQTKRHRPYGELNPIHSTPVPFNTIAMNFVVGLPESTYHGKIVNALLNVTDKYSKRIMIILGKDTHTAKDWAIALLEALQAADWGIPQQILSDRDPKFLSELWSDGALEQTNQTVKIALRYHVTENPDTPWPECIVPLQATLNNSINSTTGKTPTDLMYGFKVKEPLSLIGETGLNSQVTDLAKRRYNWKHKKLDLKEGDLVYLRLHHGYNLPGMGNRKLSNQQTGPFKIVKKVGSLAYKLELPRTIITEYLVHWKGYGPEHDEWYGKDLVDGCLETILVYEEQQGNTSVVSTLKSRLRKTPTNRDEGSNQDIRAANRTGKPVTRNGGGTPPPYTRAQGSRRTSSNSHRVSRNMDAPCEPQVTSTGGEHMEAAPPPNVTGGGRDRAPKDLSPPCCTAAMLTPPISDKSHRAGGVNDKAHQRRTSNDPHTSQQSATRDAETGSN